MTEPPKNEGESDKGKSSEKPKAKPITRLGPTGADFDLDVQALGDENHGAPAHLRAFARYGYKLDAVVDLIRNPNASRKGDSPDKKNHPNVFLRFFYVQIEGKPHRCRAVLENTRRASQGVRACVAVITVYIEEVDDE